MAPPPEIPVTSAMIAKLGAAASDSQWAAPPPIPLSTGIFASDAFIVMSVAPFSRRPIGRRWARLGLGNRGTRVTSVAGFGWIR